MPNVRNTKKKDANAVSTLETPTTVPKGRRKMHNYIQMII